MVILLDWSQPWLWIRQLRDWIRLLRTLLVSLDEECKAKMEEVMIHWRDRGRGTIALDGGGVVVSTEGDVSLPLGPGEWEEALGLPLCVVCQNARNLLRVFEVSFASKG
jgi:dynein light intermediate chain 1